MQGPEWNENGGQNSHSATSHRGDGFLRYLPDIETPDTSLQVLFLL